jgi:hypothetical protein
MERSLAHRPQKFIMEWPDCACLASRQQGTFGTMY